MLKVVGASWAKTRVSSLIVATVLALGIVIIVLSEVARVQEDGQYSATVYWSEGSGFRIEYWGEGNALGDVPQGAARAVYSPRTDNTGWAQLEVETHADYPDWVQAYAAGLLEGSLSWQLVYYHWQNTVKDTCDKHVQLCQYVRSYLLQNREWVRSKIKHRDQQDPYWHQVDVFYSQMDGLEMGWREGVARSRRDIDVPHSDFLWLNAGIDVLDLQRKYHSVEKRGDLHRSAAAMFSSVLVKLLPQSKQLLVAHNTGATFQTMLRMMKRYNLKYHLLPRDSFKMIPGSDIVLSSYPGSISSQDDFYSVTGSQHQMVVAGATIDNFNTRLWSHASPDKVLTCARVMVANRLASSGKTWAKLLERYNSGTGNKQWLVADYTRLTEVQQQTTHAPAIQLVGIDTEAWARDAQLVVDVLQRPAADGSGLLWLVEQMPGVMRYSDKSLALYKDGFWATVGLPCIKDVFEESGTSKMHKHHGDEFSPHKSLKAVALRDAARNVSDVTSAVSVMRGSDGVPSAPAGVVDTKVFAASALHAVAGPLNSPQPFQWSTSSFKTAPHAGQPDKWDFPPSTPLWAWASPNSVVAS